MLRQARGRRDALRKAARRLERQAAAAQEEAAARRQRERQTAEADEAEEAAAEADEAEEAAAEAAAEEAAAEAAAEEEKARVDAAKERATDAGQAAAPRAEDGRGRSGRGRGRGRGRGGQRVQSGAAAIAASGDAAAHLLSQASLRPLQVPAGSSDAGAAAPVAAVASVALDRPPPPPTTVTSLADAQFDTGRPEVPETIGGQTTCIICFVSPKSHAAVPCGHRSACGDCSAQMQECPVCRGPVQTWVHVRDA